MENCQWKGLNIPPFSETLWQKPKRARCKNKCLSQSRCKTRRSAKAHRKTTREAQRLLWLAKNNPISLLEDDLQDKRSTIYHELALLYTEYAEAGKLRDGPFIKYDFLKELVMRNRMSYFILKMYTDHYELIVHTPENKDVVNHPLYYGKYQNFELLDDIDDENIPRMLCDEIFSRRVGSLPLHWLVLYDSHIVLNIQRFLPERQAPIKSSFVLLKPTSDFVDYLHEYQGHSYQDHFEPLCLDPSRTLAEVHDSLLNYGSLFGSDELKFLIEKEKMHISPSGGFHSRRAELISFEERVWKQLEKIDLTKIIKKIENNKEILANSSFEAPTMSCSEDGFVVVADVAHYVTSVLSERPVNIGHQKSCCKNIIMLTDVFHFIAEIDEKKHLLQKILVYVYDGAYYFYIKICRRKFPIPMKEGNVYWIGDKENVKVMISRISEMFFSVYEEVEICHERIFENDKCSLLNTTSIDDSNNEELTEDEDGIFEACDAESEKKYKDFIEAYFAYRGSGSKKDKKKKADFRAKKRWQGKDLTFASIQRHRKPCRGTCPHTKQTWTRTKRHRQPCRGPCPRTKQMSVKTAGQLCRRGWRMNTEQGSQFVRRGNRVVDVKRLSMKTAGQFCHTGWRRNTEQRSQFVRRGNRVVDIKRLSMKTAGRFCHTGWRMNTEQGSQFVRRGNRVMGINRYVRISTAAATASTTDAPVHTAAAASHTIAAIVKTDASTARQPAVAASTAAATVKAEATAARQPAVTVSTAAARVSSTPVTLKTDAVTARESISAATVKMNAATARRSAVTASTTGVKGSTVKTTASTRRQAAPRGSTAAATRRCRDTAKGSKATARGSKATTTRRRTDAASRSRTAVIAYRSIFEPYHKRLQKVLKKFSTCKNVKVCIAAATAGTTDARVHTVASSTTAARGRTAAAIVKTDASTARQPAVTASTAAAIVETEVTTARQPAVTASTVAATVKTDANTARQPAVTVKTEATTARQPAVTASTTAATLKIDAVTARQAAARGSLSAATVRMAAVTASTTAAAKDSTVRTAASTRRQTAPRGSKATTTRRRTDAASRSRAAGISDRSIFEPYRKRLKRVLKKFASCKNVRVSTVAATTGTFDAQVHTAATASHTIAARGHTAAATVTTEATTARQPAVTASTAAAMVKTDATTARQPVVTAKTEASTARQPGVTASTAATTRRCRDSANQSKATARGSKATATRRRTDAVSRSRAAVISDRSIFEPYHKRLQKVLKKFSTCKNVRVSTAAATVSTPTGTVRTTAAIVKRDVSRGIQPAVTESTAAATVKTEATRTSQPAVTASTGGRAVTSDRPVFEPYHKLLQKLLKKFATRKNVRGSTVKKTASTRSRTAPRGSTAAATGRNTATARRSKAAARRSTDIASRSRTATTSDLSIREVYHKRLQKILKKSGTCKSEHTKGVFEANISDEKKSLSFLEKSYKLLEESSSEKRLVLYPSLNKTCVITKEDYFAMPSQTWKEDLKKLAAMDCSWKAQWKF